ncbi:MAG: helix-turn-helix domain-containing protein [Alphaproteobacteria bacterium]|nr:helix-turn-helix domain-containing protein [Alphaproteobacteria bacterium]
MSQTDPCYLNTRQAAEVVGLSPATLNRMRVTGDGPLYIKAGRRVLYDRADLIAWLNDRKRRFTAETEN